MPRPRVAIVGGGPAGLTLARVLWTRGVKVVVFESDASANVRPQGGSLDLHPKSGQFALGCAGLVDAFARVARYEDQGIRLYDKVGRLMFDHSDSAAVDRPEVDREDLRRILLQSLPEGVIRWGHKLRDVRPGDSGGHDLTFENGERYRFELVVGADGAWSRVRPLLSEAQPIYSGATLVELEIDDVDHRYSRIAKMVGRGTMLALGDRKALLAQRNAGALIRVYAARLVDEDWAKNAGLDHLSRAAARVALLDEFRDWAPELLDLIRHCGDTITVRALFALPPGHRWRNRPGVTLIGDAAHLMTPFSGQGVNSAMLDAAELGLCLTEEGDWTSSVEAYEKVMFVRAEMAAKGAAERLDDRFASDALANTLNSLRTYFG